MTFAADVKRLFMGFFWFGLCMPGGGDNRIVYGFPGHVSTAGKLFLLMGIPGFGWVTAATRMERAFFEASLGCPMVALARRHSAGYPVSAW